MMVPGSIIPVEVAFLTEETIQQFSSDFRVLAEFFRARRLGKEAELHYNKRKWIHVAEVLEFLRTFTNDRRYEDIKQTILEESRKGEEVSMCEVLDKMLELGRDELLAIGRLEGHIEGHIEGRYESLGKLMVKMASLKKKLWKILILLPKKQPHMSNG